MSSKSLISRIGIGIFGDTKKLEASFKKSQRLTKSFESAMSKQMMKAGAAVAGAFAAQFSVRMLAEMGELGAQSERLAKRFEAFAGGAGKAAEMLAAFNRGAGGAADRITALNAGGRLMQMGLVQNAQEMEKLVEMAVRLGNQTSSVEDRVSDFAAMLANQSTPRLDNFGISSGRVRMRIDELMKSVKGMTRDMAFVQATMEQGSRSLDKLGARSEDTLSSLEKMRTAFTDLKIALGESIAPSMAVIAKHSAEFAQNIITAEKNTRGFQNAIVKVANAIDMSMAAITGAVRILGGSIMMINGIWIAGLAKIDMVLTGIVDNFVGEIQAAMQKIADSDIMGLSAGAQGLADALQDLRNSAARGNDIALSINQFGLELFQGGVDQFDKAITRWEKSQKNIAERNASLNPPGASPNQPGQMSVVSSLWRLGKAMEQQIRGNINRPRLGNIMPQSMNWSEIQANALAAVKDAMKRPELPLLGGAERGSQEAARIIASANRPTVEAQKQTAKNTRDLVITSQRIEQKFEGFNGPWQLEVQ